ncbi:class C sortase [Leifsonia sp. F6_8S_P_1B]|uniref:Class C sortase n=1 Tax=Leifsonia williamsii TaxID=3035919 RepID=A0ABT8KBA7_9MICO|nr:class C sortase [Leifsonia williamsii]MDN4614718.1 class C sortase [Leifsonia williamsii]
MAGTRHPLRRRLLSVTAVAFGVGLMLYPPASTWFSDEAHASQLRSFATNSAALSPTRVDDLLERAQRYNANLPEGVLRDPYELADETAAAPATAAEADYETQLRVPGVEVMSRVTIPSIDLSLPVMHGTSPHTLDLGAGHLYGSSLPIGGPGTHAVITAHSGLVGATMFTDLGKVKVGDVFSVTTVNKPLFYRVDHIAVVEPDDISALQIVPGKDYVTLVTCTPLHVNSHRLLVRGERIAAPDALAQESATVAPAAPFPWWAVIAAGATLLGAAYVLHPLIRRSEGRRGPYRRAPVTGDA